MASSSQQSCRRHHHHFFLRHHRHRRRHCCHRCRRHCHQANRTTRFLSPFRMPFGRLTWLWLPLPLGCSIYTLFFVTVPSASLGSKPGFAFNFFLAAARFSCAAYSNAACAYLACLLATCSFLRVRGDLRTSFGCCAGGGGVGGGRGAIVDVVDLRRKYNL